MATVTKVTTGKAKVGDVIRITKVQTSSSFFPDGIDHQAEAMIGRTGTVKHIDSAGNLWGTWGGMSILPEDKYEIVANAE